MSAVLTPGVGLSHLSTDRVLCEGLHCFCKGALALCCHGKKDKTLLKRNGLKKVHKWQKKNGKKYPCCMLIYLKDSNMNKVTEWRNTQFIRQHFTFLLSWVCFQSQPPSLPSQLLSLARAVLCTIYSAFFFSENHFKLNIRAEGFFFPTPYIHYICSSPH